MARNSPLQVPVYQPSLEEWKEGLIHYVDKLLVSNTNSTGIGICKIVPPKDWWLRTEDVQKKALQAELRIRPVRQHISGKAGCFRVDLVDVYRKNGLAPKDFYTIASEIGNMRGSEETIERQFWRSVSSMAVPSLYGADQVGSLFDNKHHDGWNVKNLNSILNMGLPAGMDGITSSMLYFGTARSCFAWHTEDMELFSVNYLHCGAPKMWYAVPPAFASRLESLAKASYEQSNHCREFMRHKNVLLSPKQLRKVGISYVRMLHHPREFVVTFPRCYHMGFNTGFNIAESTNFATDFWLDYGRQARFCKCESWTLRFDIDSFVHRVRKLNPDSLHSIPRPGDLIIICWKDSGEFLVRVQGKAWGKNLVVESPVKREGFGVYPFDPIADQWRWPQDRDFCPMPGDIVSLRLTESKMRPCGLTAQGLDLVGRVLEGTHGKFVLSILGEIGPDARIPFNPAEQFWWWPSDKCRENALQSEAAVVASLPRARCFLKQKNVFVFIALGNKRQKVAGGKAVDLTKTCS